MSDEANAFSPIAAAIARGAAATVGGFQDAMAFLRRCLLWLAALFLVAVGYSAIYHCMDAAWLPDAAYHAYEQGRAFLEGQGWSRFNASTGGFDLVLPLTPLYSLGLVALGFMLGSYEKLALFPWLMLLNALGLVGFWVATNPWLKQWVPRLAFRLVFFVLLALLPAVAMEVASMSGNALLWAAEACVLAGIIALPSQGRIAGLRGWLPLGVCLLLPMASPVGWAFAILYALALCHQKQGRLAAVFLGASLLLPLLCWLPALYKGVFQLSWSQVQLAGHFLSLHTLLSNIADTFAAWGLALLALENGQQSQMQFQLISQDWFILTLQGMRELLRPFGGLHAVFGGLLLLAAGVQSVLGVWKSPRFFSPFTLLSLLLVGGLLASVASMALWPLFGSSLVGLQGSSPLVEALLPFGFVWLLLLGLSLLKAPQAWVQQTLGWIPTVALPLLMLGYGLQALLFQSGQLYGIAKDWHDYPDHQAQALLSLTPALSPLSNHLASMEASNQEKKGSKRIKPGENESPVVKITAPVDLGNGGVAFLATQVPPMQAQPRVQRLPQWQVAVKRYLAQRGSHGPATPTVLAEETQQLSYALQQRVRPYPSPNTPVGWRLQQLQQATVLVEPKNEAQQLALQEALALAPNRFRPLLLKEVGSPAPKLWERTP